MADEFLVPLIGEDNGNNRRRNDDDDRESDDDDDDGLRRWANEEGLAGDTDDENEEEVEDIEEDYEDDEEHMDSDANDADGESGEEEGAQRIVAYDCTLPQQHSYFGSEFEELSGRVMHDENSIVTMPLVSVHGVILIPGQVLPLQFEHPILCSMLKHVIEKDRTFGFTSLSMETKIGTTAEIRSFTEENQDTVPMVKIKAEGRQRFKIVETWRQIDGILMAKVQILPEIDIKHLSRYNSHLSATTPWPKFVYRMYDPDYLIEKIKQHLRSWAATRVKADGTQESTLSFAPTSVVGFSYWVAENLPLDDTQRLELLQLNCPIQRLRWELGLLDKYSYLRCVECKQRVCKRDDVFSMSSQGPQNTFVNPSGFVHETLTVYKTSGLTLIGGPREEYSWFPGYAWTPTQCTRCRSHLGWKFTVTKNSSHLKPSHFWGLCRTSIEPQLKDDSDDAWKPVI